jgi:hypothetical protein
VPRLFPELFRQGYEPENEIRTHYKEQPDSHWEGTDAGATKRADTRDPEQVNHEPADSTISGGLRTIEVAVYWQQLSSRHTSNRSILRVNLGSRRPSARIKQLPAQSPYRNLV